MPLNLSQPNQLCSLPFEVNFEGGSHTPPWRRCEIATLLEGESTVGMRAAEMASKLMKGSVAVRDLLRPRGGEAGRHDGIADVEVQLLAAVEVGCRTPLEPQYRGLLLLRAAMA